MLSKRRIFQILPSDITISIVFKINVRLHLGEALTNENFCMRTFWDMTRRWSSSMFYILSSYYYYYYYYCYHYYYLCSYYYESHAFLRDEEVVSPFRQLLTGLSQIGFDIPVDTASLEFAPAPEVLEPVLRLRAPQPIQGAHVHCTCTLLYYIPTEFDTSRKNGKNVVYITDEVL